MKIEFSLKHEPANHITYDDAKWVKHSLKYCTIKLGNGTKIKIPESELEDLSWGR